MKDNQPITKPLFSIGDLVKIRGFGIVLTKSNSNLGVIARGPYSYKSVESYHDLVYFEWWCYDVLIGSELVRMMPENFLLEVDINEN
ncbi:hypothetical protein N8467_01030 [bacterium]|nr:hypothetical protein [bacterium]